MHELCDLRSDTVTRPTAGMREAMLKAEVGDNVYAEDPTIAALEARAARLLGKEAALFVVSGTMANALAIRLSCEPGDEAVCEAQAHPIMYEAGGSPAFSGVTFKPVAGEHGILAPDAVEAVLYPTAYYRPVQKALLLENTSNRGGGTVYPIARVRELASVARRHGLRVHMDGARLWNASVASGVGVAEYAACCDTVSCCFSKGLGAPVGSILAGTRKDIERAWHYRHMLGGSWRQAGILAAAAIYALDHHVERLKQDHALAHALAEGLEEECGLEIVNPVETNMVYFRHRAVRPLLERLKGERILMSEVRPGVVRCVTHLDVDFEDVGRTIETARKLAK